VCVVEDDPTVRAWLAEVLAVDGAAVVACAGTLAEGRDVIRRHRPDLAVIDKMLPDGSGIALCQEITRSVAHVALILLAGSMTPHQEREAHAAGVGRVVLKTIDGGGLRQAVEALTARCNRTDGQSRPPV
jgi:DNA-binding response OmpR family regulator